MRNFGIGAVSTAPAKRAAKAAPTNYVSRTGRGLAAGHMGQSSRSIWSSSWDSLLNRVCRGV